MISEVYNSDCLEAMRLMPDKAFDLAIVDPPYGIDCDLWGSGGSKPELRTANLNPKKWDGNRPNADYFAELRRVSRNQIIWGGNHFADLLPATPAFIVWDKQIIEGVSLGDCELAWTSFPTRVRKFTLQWCGYLRGSERGGGNRIHPTQKPVVLYKWLLTNYAKPGDTILDTHLGSGSSRIAAYDLGFDFTGYELDTDYFEAQEQRFADHIAQPKLFAPMPVVEIQEGLF